MYQVRRPGDPARYLLRYRQLLVSAADIGSDGATGLHPADLAALRKPYAP